MQLLELGFSSDAVQHRLEVGRLHRIFPGVYAVGRAQLTECARWLAAVLACGPNAVLSHISAALLWGILRGPDRTIEVSVPARVARRVRGVVVHRRSTLTDEDLTERHAIPVTTPACTLVDLAARLPRRPLEAAVNEADGLGLIDPPALRSSLGRMSGRHGVPALRTLLDDASFRLTDSDLERLFLPIAHSAGLPLPETGTWLNGFQVDFWWPELGLVVETDGLTYHRTPAQQARDRLRDQAHAAAGLTPLRFTHAQVRFRSNHVRATLAAVASRLRELRA